MKKFILFLAIGVLFQSCYSYKAIENNPSALEIGKHYKIKQDKKSIALKVLSKTDSTIVYKSFFKEREISNDEITSVKRRKFSVVKTAIYIPVATILFLSMIFSGKDFPYFEFYYFKFILVT